MMISLLVLIFCGRERLYLSYITICKYGSSNTHVYSCFALICPVHSLLAHGYAHYIILAIPTSCHAPFPR